MVHLKIICRLGCLHCDNLRRKLEHMIPRWKERNREVKISMLTEWSGDRPGGNCIPYITVEDAEGGIVFDGRELPVIGRLEGWIDSIPEQKELENG